MAASKTLMNVKKADAAPALDRVSNVLGSEQTNETTAPIAAKPMVQTLCATFVQIQDRRGWHRGAYQTLC